MLKNGDRQDVGNYRPISILPIPGKVIEKIYHRHINEYLELHSILNTRQGGFRKYHSTVKTIAELTDNIFNNINEKYITGATFIDFNKASDTVDHAILKQKLKLMGITGKTLE